MSTLQQINQKAQRLLRTELGPVDYVRNQQQFSQGNGDYTAARQTLPSEDLSSISQRVGTMKAAGLLPIPPSARVIEVEPQGMEPPGT